MFRTALRSLRAVRPAQMRAMHTARPHKAVSRSGFVLGASTALMLGGVIFNEAKKEEADKKDGEAPEGQQGAYDPETGEINWDCPCLGGMANGPCGEEFKEAFSCFVYSKAEPKGMDCIEKFSGMQDCFRKHPEIYADQLRDDEEEEAVVQEAVTKKEAPAEVIEEVSEVVDIPEKQPMSVDAQEIKTVVHDAAKGLHDVAEDVTAKVDYVAKKVGLVADSEDVRKAITEAIKSAEDAIDHIADSTDSIVDSLGGSVDKMGDQIKPVIEKITPVIEKIEELLDSGDKGDKK
ncbi:Mitochondrial intermembrane space import and assembly protein 40 [Yarrowia sp. B02]|nr:Mitochondrial intermembrane space import and assembly protein 40 [Yarrowia sp. B02]